MTLLANHDFERAVDAPYLLTPTEIIQRFQVDSKLGLTEAEVLRRRSMFGSNVIVEGVRIAALALAVGSVQGCDDCCFCLLQR